MNVGDYVSRLPGMTLNTYAFDAPTEWMNSWTLFFWAWSQSSQATSRRGA